MNYLIDNLSLIIPTKNDHLRIKENLEENIEFLKTNIKNFEILIVSNGSTIESSAFIDELIKRYKFIQHINIIPSGKGLAIKKGLVNSKFDTALFMDADSSVKISEFKKFVENKQLKSPFVIGNRKNNLSRNIGSPFLRKLSGYIYLKIVKTVFNVDLEDTQCGFKAIDKSRFSTYLNFHTDGFSFDMELILLAKKENINTLEIPVIYIHNTDSKVKVYVDTFKMLKDLIRIKKNLNL